MKPFDAAKLLGISDMSAHLTKIETELIDAAAADSPALQEPLARLVRAGSKRLRSILTIAVANSANKEIDQNVISGCVAVELLHIGSLVHDDIIDEASTRWGIPTVNSKEGVSQAILVGDFLFAKAGVVASSINTDAAGLISSTIAALVDGESREVADEFNQSRTIDSMNAAIRGKTAALVSAACQMGGIASGLEKGKIKILAQFGESFGMAFQIIDDVLDFVSSEDLMGKPVGNDVKEGVYTLPLLFALQGNHAAEARRLLGEEPVEAAKLKELLVTNGYIEKAITEASKYNQQANSFLDGMSGTSGLAKLPQAYTQWAINNLTEGQ